MQGLAGDKGEILGAILKNKFNGDPTAFQLWMATPNKDLGGDTPTMELIIRPQGAGLSAIEAAASLIGTPAQEKNLVITAP